jgi:hypothetical protein
MYLFILTFIGVFIQKLILILLVCIYYLQGITSLFYLSSSDIFALINYASLVDNFAQVGVISGLLLMRITMKDLERPIKVSILFILLFLYPHVYIIIHVVSGVTV